MQRRYTGLLALVCCMVTHFLPCGYAADEKSPAWGTSNNFGSGDPLCWTSQIAKDKSLTTFESDIDDWENEVFDENQTSTKLLSQCFPESGLKVVPTNLDEDSTILTTRDYTFEIRLEAVLKFIDPDIVLNSTFTKGYVRLLMCDALKRGFCNPLVDLRDPLSDIVDPNDELRYKYTQGDVLETASDDNGAVSFSRWVEWEFKTNETDSEPSLEDPYTLIVDITLQLPEGTEAAPYFFIAHSVLTFDLKDKDYLLRIDIADAVPDNIVQVRDPPLIDQVSDGTIIAVAVLSGVFGGLGLLTLVFIVAHRDHQIMKLAQAPFLAAFNVANLSSIAFSFTNLPLKDEFCQISGPAILISLTAAGAILVARTWRIYSTVAAALALGRSNEKSFADTLSNGYIEMLNFIASFPFRYPRKRAHRNLRSTVSQIETVTLATWLTIPQIILQIFLTLQNDLDVMIDLSEDKSFGREICGMNKRSMELTGVAIAAIPCIMAVWLAWIARSLPSFLNEKEQVFSSAGLCISVAVVAFTVLLVVDEPTTSVDMIVLLKCLMSIGIPVIMIYYVVLPKIRRVQSGELFVMSSLFASSSQQSQRDETTSSDCDGNRPDFIPAQTKRFSAVTPVKLKKDDPLPPRVEKSTLEVHRLLASVTSRSSEGRTLSSQEWKTVRAEVARLKMELDAVELTWDDAFEDMRATDEGTQNEV